MRELHVTAKDSSQRLDKYLLKYFNKAPSGFVYKMLRKKNIKLNNMRANGADIVKVGDTIQIYMLDTSIDKFRDDNIHIPETNITFNVLFEDDLVIFLDKPAGILSQPAHNGDNNALTNQLEYYLYKNGDYDPHSSVFRPGICNRLDTYTSGIVASGKSVNALQALNNMFKQRGVDKIYTAVVSGAVKSNGRLTSYITKNNATNTVTISSNANAAKETIKEAILEYKPLATNNISNLSIVEITLISGLSHQIRVQMSDIGHPVIGDKKYGNNEINSYFQRKYNIGGQLLHCHKIIINNLGTPLEYLCGKQIISPLPQHLNKIVREEF